MNRPEQKRLFGCVRSVETRIEALDMDRLRVIFRDLFDQADRKLQRTGFDHDDIEIRRLLLCRQGDGAMVRISADSLADREMFIEQVRHGLPGCADGAFAIADVVVARAEIDVVRDEWTWYGDPAERS